MTERHKFRSRNSGHRLEELVFTEYEQRGLRQPSQSMGQIACPK
jgi:hypothetical protein